MSSVARRAKEEPLADGTVIEQKESQKKLTEPTVFQQAYDFTHWYAQHTAGFPRTHRFTLGDRIESGLFELLASLQDATYGRRRPESLARAQHCVDRLRQELLSNAYRPGGYRQFVLREAKPRLISAAPFRDRVVHHALCRVLEPIWDRRFIFDSYACRPGKGTPIAADRYQEFPRRARHVPQCDVSKYFPSIGHSILWEQIRDVVPDREGLRLATLTLATSGDERLLWPSGRGLPLGNQTSRFFANVYRDPFDHSVKETLRRGLYLRYVDDFIVLGDSAWEFTEVREVASERLAALGLKLHAKKRRIFPVREACDFVGYRIFPDHRLLRRHTGYRFRRRYRGMMRALARTLGGLSFSPPKGTLMTVIDCRKRIVRNPKVCGGQPVFKGTRVTLRTVLASLADGDTVEEILEAFPTLKQDDVRAAIAFAARSAEEDLPVPGLPRAR